MLLDTFYTSNAEETQNAGKRMAPFLGPGTILGLKGEIGAGKTTLIQGICQGLHVKGKVISPTFVLMHVYEGRLPVYHFDLYRLGPKDFSDLGWEDYLEGNGVSILEWIDRAEEEFPFGYLEILIEYGESPNLRKLSLCPRGKAFPWVGEFISHLR